MSGRRCCFCGRKADSDEHLLSEWVGRVLPTRDLVLHFRLTLASNEPTNRARMRAALTSFGERLCRSDRKPSVYARVGDRMLHRWVVEHLSFDRRAERVARVPREPPSSRKSPSAARNSGSPISWTTASLGARPARLSAWPTAVTEFLDERLWSLDSNQHRLSRRFHGLSVLPSS